MRAPALGFSLGLILSGCGTLNEKAATLSVGDTKDQVLQTLGPPADRQSNGPNEAWQYCISGAGVGWNDHKLVWFRNERVSGINSYRSGGTGCQSGIREVRWENAPNSTVEIRVR